MARRYAKRWRMSLPATKPEPPRPLGRGDQLRLRVESRDRKYRMTVEELRREQPEAQMYAHIVTALNAHAQIAMAWDTSFVGYGWFEPRSRPGERRFIKVGFAGQPDITGFTRLGRPLFLEVKRPGLKAEPHQDAFLAFAARHGAICGVVHSVEEALALIAEATSYEASITWLRRPLEEFEQAARG